MNVRVQYTLPSTGLESTESLVVACERLVWNSRKKRWSQSLQRYGRTTIDRAFSITPLLFDLRIELLPQREHLIDIMPSDQKLTVNSATVGLSATGENTEVT